MKIQSSRKGKNILLNVNGKNYEIHSEKRIKGKMYHYLLSKQSRTEAFTFGKLLKERKLAENVRIIRHSSGAYRIYRYNKN